MEYGTQLIICFLVITHVLVYLIGKSTEPNREINRNWSEYEEFIKQKEDN